MSVHRPPLPSLEARMDILRNASDYVGFAEAIGLSGSSVAYTFKTCDKNTEYKTYTKEKKCGGVRVISEPPNSLKHLQSLLADLLKSYIFELEKSQCTQGYIGWIKNRISHGALPKTSIVSNARAHTKKGVVLNFDLQDFFPSIHAGRIVGFLKADKRLRINDFSARRIAYIATFEGTLPQGSPLSPILADLIAGVLDSRLAKIASENNLRLSRYVDDISISSSSDALPDHIVKLLDNGSIELGEQIRKAVEKSGFHVNESKTRLHLRGSSQRATGLVVNTYPNVSSKYYRDTRAMYHSLSKTGEFTVGSSTFSASDAHRIISRIAFITDVRDAERIRVNEGQPIKKSKAESWPSDKTLAERVTFYAKCAQPDRAIMLCEGGLDHFHFQLAKRQLEYTFYHADVEGRKHFELKVRQLSQRQRTLLSVGDGADALKNFVSAYRRNIDEVKLTQPPPPVFAVFDYDDAGRKVVNVLKDQYKINIPHSLAGSITNVYENLYVCFIPAANGENTAVEDLYPQHVLDAKLSGKSFRKSGGKEYYGKEVFAVEIAAKRAERSDFAVFMDFFDKINVILKKFYS